MTVADHLTQQLSRMHKAFGEFPDEASQQLARDMRGVRTAAELRAMAQRVLHLVPLAVKSLRDAIAANFKMLDRDQADAERQAAALRDKRETAEDFQASRERVRGTAVDLAQMHLPAAGLSPKALAFAASVAIPALNGRAAQQLCQQAQQRFFGELIEVAAEVFDEQRAETERTWAQTGEALGAAFEPLPVRAFRPPEFTPIGYATTVDSFEKLRAIALGGALAGMLISLGGILALIFGWLLGAPLALVGAMSGYASLRTMKAAQFRRELPGIAAEQCRRVQVSVVRQLHAYHDAAEFAARQELRRHLRQAGDDVRARFAYIEAERAKTRSYSATAERLLAQAESAAREIVRLIPKE